MAAEKIEAFGGMVPAVDDRLLPKTAAARSENAWLYTGSLLGMNRPTLLRAMTNSAAVKVYRIPNNFVDLQHLDDSVWMEFEDKDTDVIRSPVIGETFGRYYWVAPTTQALYNTLARITAGNTGANAPYFLGIPKPSVVPTVTPVGGVSGTTRTSAYVYTWVSAYGEEGPPSDPTLATGKVDASWNVTLTAALPADLGTDRNLTLVRIYRTVTSTAGVATYFLVVEQAIATTTYADTKTDTVVSANSQLLSTNWFAPPVDLKGWTAMPNGIIAGFRANEVWFCEPYRPHAWPPQYAVTVDYPIVGLGVSAQSLVVGTQNYPAAISGIHPSIMSQSKLAALEPCVSRGGMLSTPEGVYYASPNGLVLVAHGQATNITRDLITKDRWQLLAGSTAINTLRAARMGSGYYAFGTVRQGVFEPTAFEPTAFTQEDFTGGLAGVLIDPANQRVAFNILSNTVPCDNVMNDPWSGEVFVVRSGNLYWINTAAAAPTYETFLWRSKIFQANEPRNFAAMRVYFSTPATSPTLNPVRNTNLVQTLQADQWGLVRVYADGTLVTTRELRTSGELMRIVSGFKADYWQFEIESRLDIKSFQFATSAKELAKV